MDRSKMASSTNQNSPPKRKNPSRSASPASSTPLKRVKTEPVENENGSIPAEGDGSLTDPNASIDATPLDTEPLYCFKDPNFIHSTKGAAGSKKTRVWKNLKQIISVERSTRKPDEPTYGSLDALPSLKPAKKYSEITGLQALYTDPQTKMHYASTDEFARIRMLPADIVAGYLTLRKAHNPVP